MENSNAVSRRDLLAGGLSALALAPLGARKAFQSTTTSSAITTGTVNVGGLLLETTISGLPPYVLESDRGTAFLPIYIEGSLEAENLVGQHVTVTGQLTNCLAGYSCPPPALIMKPSSIEASSPPSPAVPECGKTLEEVPLTSQETATLEQMLIAYIDAGFGNPDMLSEEMIQDQAIQALSSEAFDEYLLKIPFVFVVDEHATPCLKCYNFGEFVAFVKTCFASDATSDATATSAAADPINAACALVIARILILFLLGLIVAVIPRRTVAAIEAQARALITNPAVMAGLNTIYNAVKKLIAGTFTGRQVGPIVVAAIQTMAAPLGAALLALVKTLGWAQYVLAVAQAAAIWVKVVIIVAKIAFSVNDVREVIATCA